MLGSQWKAWALVQFTMKVYAEHIGYATTECYRTKNSTTILKHDCCNADDSSSGLT